MIKLNSNESSIIKKYSLLELLCVAMGIFITAPIISIKVAGNYISVFSILFILFIVSVSISAFISRDIFRMGKTTRMYLAWFYLSIVSSLFGLIYFSSMIDWKNTIIGYMPKIVIYFILLIILTKSQKKENIIECFFIGFLLGCIINICWAIIEGIVYYVFGYSLNNQIFAGYMATLPPDRQFITITHAGGIRTPGFNYDPAHLGGLIPIVVLYSCINRKYLLLILSGIALIFSQSTTALVSSLILLIININKLKFLSIKLNIKKIIVCVVAFCIIVFFLLTFFQSTNIFDSINMNFKGFAERVSSVYIGNKDIRTLYHLCIPLAVWFSGFKVLTGTGFGTASYPYVYSQEIANFLGINNRWPYDPESTYISYLFDVGVIGLILYIVILCKNYSYYGRKCSNKLNSLIFSSFGGIILSGFFYHYTLTAYQVITIIMGTVLMDTNKCNETKSLGRQSNESE